MNKTVNITLANNSFCIDESGYASLRKYLETIERALEKTLGKENILEDIEARISELFEERKKHQNYVISSQDVKTVIEVLGKPQDFILDDEEQVEVNEEGSVNKRLFRDSDDKYIGGVASGVAHYFGIDPTVIRLILVVLAIFSAGTFLFLYIIFWIIVPKATTTAEKLRMKGQPVNIATIQKTIKNEFETVSEKIKNVDYNKTTSIVKKKSEDVFSFFKNFFELFFGVIGKIIGFFFMVGVFFAFLAATISFFSLIFIGVWVWEPFEYFYSWFGFSNLESLAFLTSLFLAIVIPLLLVFMLGIRLVFSKSKPFAGTTKLILLIIWVGSILSIAFFGFRSTRFHAVVATSQEENKIPFQENDTILITFNLKKPLGGYQSKATGDEFYLFHDKQNRKWIVSRDIELNIKKSVGYTTELLLEKEADGYDYFSAEKTAKEIEYHWEVRKNELLLDSYWKTLKENHFHEQRIIITLWIPEGKVIQFSENAKNFLKRRIPNDQSFSRRKMVYYFWEMGKRDLECLDCNFKPSSLELKYEDSEEDFNLKIDKDGIEIKRGND